MVSTKATADPLDARSMIICHRRHSSLLWLHVEFGEKNDGSTEFPPNINIVPQTNPVKFQNQRDDGKTGTVPSKSGDEAESTSLKQDDGGEGAKHTHKSMYSSSE